MRRVHSINHFVVMGKPSTGQRTCSVPRNSVISSLQNTLPTRRSGRPLSIGEPGPRGRQQRLATSTTYTTRSTWTPPTVFDEHSVEARGQTRHARALTDPYVGLPARWVESSTVESTPPTSRWPFGTSICHRIQLPCGDISERRARSHSLCCT